MATAPASRAYKNFINGEWVAPKHGKTLENRNPANTDEVLGIFPLSSSEDVEAAVEAAKAAYKNWRLTPAPKRAEILYRAAELLVKRKEEFSRDMTREMGKVLAETRGDVQEAIDMTYYMAGEGRRLFGQTTPSELPNKFAMSVRQSIGVCGLITPWNFPMAIPAWKIMPALVSGNTLVIKPAEDTPLSTYNLVEILAEAGLPAGVVNLVSGDGPGAGAALTKHPDVPVVSFTGSTSTGRIIAWVLTPVNSGDYRMNMRPSELVQLKRDTVERSIQTISRISRRADRAHRAAARLGEFRLRHPGGTPWRGRPGPRPGNYRNRRGSGNRGSEGRSIPLPGTGAFHPRRRPSHQHQTRETAGSRRRRHHRLVPGQPRTGGDRPRPAQRPRLSG